MPDGTFDTDANDTIHWCRTKSCIFWEKHPRKVWGEEGCPNIHFLNIPYIYGRTDTYLTSHDLPFDLPSPSNYLMIFHLPPKTIYSYWMERLWRMDGIGPIWPIRILGHCKRFRVYGCNHSYGEIQKYGLFCISGPRPRIQDPQKIAVIFIHCLGYKEVNCRGVPQPVPVKKVLQVMVDRWINKGLPTKHKIVTS